jgi:DNA-binding transcriptional MerR regulator
VSNLDISELKRRAGLPASTIRYYEEQGLIRSIGRRGLHRVFDESALEQLALIGLGRAAGFSLKEISRMFGPDGRPRIQRQTLAAKADELETTITKLTKLRDGLRHAAACPAPSHLECPTFRRLLRAVTVGTIRAERVKRRAATRPSHTIPAPTPRSPKAPARRRRARRSTCRL